MNDTDFASCADDNAPYVSVYTIYEVIKRLEIASVKFTEMVCRWLKKPVVKLMYCLDILFMTVGKRRIIMNAFFNSQFNYFPLVWMLHSHSINNY